MYWRINPLTVRRCGILIKPALPATIGMSEIRGGLKLTGDMLMAGELQAVIKGDRLNRQTTSAQGFDGRASQCTSAFGS